MDKVIAINTIIILIINIIRRPHRRVVEGILPSDRPKAPCHLVPSSSVLSCGEKSILIFVTLSSHDKVIFLTTVSQLKPSIVVSHYCCWSLLFYLEAITQTPGTWSIKLLMLLLFPFDNASKHLDSLLSLFLVVANNVEFVNSLLLLNLLKHCFIMAKKMVSTFAGPAFLI